MRNFKLLFFITILNAIMLIASCKEDKDDVIQDLDQTAALKKVVFTYDSMSINIGLPAGALSGVPFDTLLAQDSATYANPENYSIETIACFTADNTASDAGDAKFDGMDLDIIMDTINSGPIEAKTDAFEVKANEVKAVQAKDSINLKTHRLTGLYMFRQIVDGADLATTLKPDLKYSIGSQSGSLPLPATQHNIPTRASDEMKDFLSGLLESGVFDEPAQ